MDPNKLNHLYALVADLEALKTERAGMDAENAQRGACGHSMAYTMENYAHLQGRMEAIAHMLRELGR